MQALYRCALLVGLVTLIVGPNAVRCATINEIIEDVIQRTNRIVDTAERQVLRDADETLADIRQRTLNTRITDNIDGVSVHNTYDTEQFLRRTLRRIATAEDLFGQIYRRAVAQIRQQVAGSLQEPVVRSALRRINEIVDRCIQRINSIAIRARNSVRDQAHRSAEYLGRLHDRAVRSDPEEQARDQDLLSEHVEAATRNVRNTIERGKNAIDRTVDDSENEVRREARPDIALSHYRED